MPLRQNKTFHTYKKRRIQKLYFCVKRLNTLGLLWSDLAGMVDVAGNVETVQAYELKQPLNGKVNPNDLIQNLCGNK